MKLVAKVMLRTKYLGCCLLALAAISKNALAATVNYPGDFPPRTVPFSTSATGDALSITSSTMQTPSSSSTEYTINLSTLNNLTANTININFGAAASYQGTNGGAATISSARADTNTTTNTININGALNSGTGLYAIYLRNTNATPNDTHVINISHTGNISGSIITNNVASASVNINGGGVVNVDGVINLSVKSGGNSSLNIGNAVVFTPTQSITNIGLLRLSNNSTMNLNVLNTNIKAVTIDAGSIFNLNYTLAGLTSGDGNIINNGTFNIAASINKSGTFTGTGTNVVSEGAASGLTIATSSYAIAMHTAVMNDILNYGNINLTNSTITNTTANFNVINGGGYFPAGTYTLVTSLAAPTYSSSNFSAPPASTLFLAFGTPVVNDKKIQITLTRTPFTTFATNSLTQEIAGNLETLGANNPLASMVNLLNAVEASTTGNQVELALQQLAPLANAPFYGYDVQNDTMYQVQLRLASLHNNQTNYFAGDIAKDNNVWLRPFGSYGNQKQKDDSLGYYASSGGIVAGFDRNLDDNYTVGAAFAYAISHVKDKINTQSVTDLKSYIAMIYGTYNFTYSEYVDWIVAITANSFNADRVVSINNVYSQTANSSYGSQQAAIRALWGKNYPAFGFMQLTPEGMAQYTFSKQYTYTETGAQGANLTIGRTNSNIVTVGLGGKAAIPILVNPSIVMPEIHGMVYYNPIAGKQNTIFNFVDGGGSMISTMNLSRTGLRIGAALTIAVVDRLEVKVNFDYDIEDRFNGYTGYLNLRYML